MNAALYFRSEVTFGSNVAPHVHEPFREAKLINVCEEGHGLRGIEWQVKHFVFLGVN